MNEQGGPWPAYTVGYGETFEDDELADATGNGHASGRTPRAGEARASRIRAIASKDRANVWKNQSQPRPSCPCISSLSGHVGT